MDPQPSPRGGIDGRLDDPALVPAIQEDQSRQLLTSWLVLVVLALVVIVGLVLLAVRSVE